MLQIAVCMSERAFSEAHVSESSADLDRRLRERMCGGLCDFFFFFLCVCVCVNPDSKLRGLELRAYA